MRIAIGILLVILVITPQAALPFTTDEIDLLQRSINAKPVGGRIAFWAEQFIGTPYDTDPLGDYVTRARIVADERVDCMYLTFRAVELALSTSPEEAIRKALTLRFRTRGMLQNELVMNYDDRYQDGLEMITSGKYGSDITGRIGKTTRAAPDGHNPIEFLPASEIEKGLGSLHTGDIIYFVRSPAQTVGGIIAHMGIVKIETGNNLPNNAVNLIHASGTKKKGGIVKKVLLGDYLAHMQHAGAMVSRFSDTN